MADERPILVTGAGGGVGGVGRTVVSLLRETGRPVRAMVHHDDDRACALRTVGAEVVVGDLTHPGDVARALEGCGRMLFCMGVSADYLEGAVVVTAVARSLGTLEVLVNLSQMTVSQMTLTSTEESRQQRLHWLAEQVLDWSGLPVVHVRPTMFLENPMLSTIAARSVAERGVLALPFGTGRSSPVAAADVARVIATILLDPRPHVASVYELTGPRSQDMTATASEFSRALGRPVTYEDVPHEVWVEEVLTPAGLPPHTQAHLDTMARLHRENRYDRLTDTVESLTGRPAQSVEAFVAERAARFRPVTS
jgi:uncharacterized protein YbjT (DUF2867 family)